MPEGLLDFGLEVRFAATFGASRALPVNRSGGGFGDQPACWADVSHSVRPIVQITTL